MTATTLVSERISISSETIRAARKTAVVRDASLVLRTPEGVDVELPGDVQEMLLRALHSIAATGSATISQVPDELTSTVAADMLGVSRPTLLKWAREGKIDSFPVNTHTRFRRDDVVAFREERDAERRRAVEELMAFDAEHAEFLDD